MNRLNEKTIVKIFQDKLGNKKFIPEDVEFFKIGKKYVAVKVDTLVESTDMPYGTKLEDAARKSTQMREQNLSLVFHYLELLKKL